MIKGKIKYNNSSITELTPKKSKVILYTTEKYCHKNFEVDFECPIYGGKIIKSIDITSAPNRYIYTTLNTLDLTGLVITVTYVDDTTEDVTSKCIFNPALGSVLTTSNNKVTIDYNGLILELEIYVSEPYLTFWSPNAFILASYNSSQSTMFKGWDGTMEYSTDKTNWATWSGVSYITAAQAADNNYYLYVRGTGNTYVTGGANLSSYYCVWAVYKSDISGIISDAHCNGNIETLLDYNAVINGLHPTMAIYAFANMFYGNGLVDLPLMLTLTLTERCYYNMFNECSSIKLYTSQMGNYRIPYRIPTIGTGTNATNALTNMFYLTGGVWYGTPSINTTYYLWDYNL